MSGWPTVVEPSAVSIMSTSVGNGVIWRVSAAAFGLWNILASTATSQSGPVSAGYLRNPDFPWVHRPPHRVEVPEFVPDLLGVAFIVTALISSMVRN